MNVDLSKNLSSMLTFSLIKTFSFPLFKFGFFKLMGDFFTSFLIFVTF